uniref:UBA domain-containing protein n=2 Tax=Palpitomonas bilix TaxID=652834 RepID=A0A7S3DJK3_9EUKA|mmetsp:Transcript_40825/g.105927  ORF Transcript_40825/g.105927 Transcript_40825/m.105927 type:complete len:298 (+) Transcript_40825:93-986(+)
MSKADKVSFGGGERDGGQATAKSRGSSTKTSTTHSAGTSRLTSAGGSGVGSTPAGVDRSDQAIFSLYASGKPVEACTVIRERGVDPNTVNAAGRTLLHIAAAKEDVEAIRHFLAVGVDAGIADKFGLLARDLPTSAAVVAEVDGSYAVWKRLEAEQTKQREVEERRKERKAKAAAEREERRLLPSAKLFRGDADGTKTLSLIALGYAPHEALEALQNADFDEDRALTALTKKVEIGEPTKREDRSAKTTAKLLKDLNAGLVMYTPKRKDLFDESWRKRKGEGEEDDNMGSADVLKIS